MALLEVNGVTKYYSRERRTVVAVDNASVHVASGETLGIIGESGAGKSTLGRIAAAMIRPDAGTVLFEERDLSQIGRTELRQVRRSIQVVFQEPFESLDPRMRVVDLVAEPLDIHRRETSHQQRRTKARDALARVGLQEQLWSRWPAQLSGGEQQRVGIARAIVSEPRLVLLDEPTSSLDLSLRAGIIQLLTELQKEQNLAYVVVSHDMSTVEHISDRVAVMYHGRIVEQGSADDVVNRPRHPYTRLLMEARLSIDPQVRTPPAGPAIARPLPSGAGCVFYPRCPIAVDECAAAPVGLAEVDRTGHEVACIRVHKTTSQLHRSESDS